MTDQPTFEYELSRRALIEEAAFAFETEDGVEIANALCSLDGDKLIHLASVVHEDRTNPIAATAVVRPALELVLDEAAVIAKFAQEAPREV